MNKIIVETTIDAPLEKVWQCWTQPEHITKWNFASDDWHCPSAENNLVVGGEFHYAMAAKDASFSFDFWGTYNKIETEKLLEITLGDGRKMSVIFERNEAGTIVTEVFEPETTNSLELQKTGWQLILNNFKQHVECHI
jgi:uncharacterized protein YndB with AHSA1/START domain